MKQARSLHSSSRPVALGEVLADRRHSDLRALLQRVIDLRRLQEQVARLLPTDIAAHCRVANLRDGILVLLASSPAWATRLRCCVQGLLEPLNNERPAPSIRSIRINVSIPEGNDTGSPGRPMTLSAGNAKLLQAAAADADPLLRIALLRLSGR